VGIVVVVAAGNNNEDARYTTRQRAVRAQSVASTDADARATFSNHGTLVDVMAPWRRRSESVQDGVVASECGRPWPVLTSAGWWY
jgi:hypothetical protein